MSSNQCLSCPTQHLNRLCERSARKIDEAAEFPLLHLAVMGDPRPFKPNGTAPPFDLEEYKDTFPVWKMKWDVYLRLSNIDEDLEQARRAQYKADVLISCLSPTTLHTVMSMGLTANELKDHAVIITKLEERCKAGRNQHVWRHQFHLKRQLANQSFDDYLCELRDIGSKCSFETGCCGHCLPARLLDQIVVGVEDDDLRVKLIEKAGALTLDNAIQLAQAMEASSKSVSSLRNDSSSVDAIRSKSTYRQQKIQTQQSAVTSGQRGDSKPGRYQNNKNKASTGCHFCGSETSHPRKVCTASNKQCYNCDKIGHFATVCTAPPKTPESSKTVHEVSIQGVGKRSREDMVSMSITSSTGKSIVTSALPDTGAQIDAIPSVLYHKSFSSVPLQPSASAETATGTAITCEGTFSATLDWRAGDHIQQPINTTIHILKDLKQPVISKATQVKLGMLSPEYPHTRTPRSTVATMSAAPTEQTKQQDLAVLKELFPKVFDGVCRPMKGKPCHLTVREGTVPVQARRPRPVSEPLLPATIKELQLQIDQKLLRRATEPTDWIHGMVVAMKKPPTGEPSAAPPGVRICVDFRELNKCLARKEFPNATPHQAVRSIPKGMRYFTVIDAFKGYHQVALDEESSKLTTFASPLGLLQYTRLPMGIRDAGDDYGERIDPIFSSIPNTRRVMEDILAFSETYEEHKVLVRKLFEAAAEHQVSIGAKKLQFAQESVKYAGYEVSGEGFSPDPELTRAIREFPVPTSTTDVRSFNGLCQQVGNFSTEVSQCLDPLSPLLKKNCRFEWSPVYDAAFNKARELLSKVPHLDFYDVKAPTRLTVDASKLNGLGFVLQQQDQSGKWQLIQAGSRFLSSAEESYAMIELECLAAAWAMEKCYQFLEGLAKFTLATDHRPLIPILNDYPLDKLHNTRLRRLRERMLLRFCFTAVWIAGKKNQMADALSRAPISRPTRADELAEGYIETPVKAALIQSIAGSDSRLIDPIIERVKKAAAEDPVMTELRETILNGFPNQKSNLPLILRPFWCVREQLAIDETDGVIVVGSRIVIPKALTSSILKDLVSMHQGATKLRQRARLSVYWPHMDVDIANAAKLCESCTEVLPSHPPEPLIQHAPASRPFEQIHTDLAEVQGRHFLILVDQFSGWPDVVPFPNKNTTSAAIVKAFRSFFIGVGVPVKMWSDEDTKFISAETKKFLAEWGVTLGTSSPRYAQSNGRAEAEVKEMKKLIRGSWTTGAFDDNKFGKSILLFRNSPRSGGDSPAQIVFGRPMRDCLPAHHRSFAVEWQKLSHFIEKRERRAEAAKNYYDRKAHPLTPFTVGSNVLIQHPTTKYWSTPGVVIEVGDNRDYLIKTSAGRVFRRNRRFLRRRFVVPPAAKPTVVIPTPAVQPAPAMVVANEFPAAEQPDGPEPAAAGHIPAQPMAQPPAVRQSTRNKGPKTWKYPDTHYVSK